MPITTPQAFQDQYRDDHDHFLHTLEYLFKPAIEKAGFRAISPIAQGGELIQAELVKSLSEADMALCDMSTLNANVFFELGIRTALNLPVALTTDGVSGIIPFDTHNINRHEYSHELHHWEMENQIDLLASHIKTSYEKANGVNAVWRHFGMQSAGTPLGAEPAGSDDAMAYKLDWIFNNINSLLSNKTVNPRPPVSNIHQTIKDSSQTHQEGIVTISVLGDSYKVLRTGKLKPRMLGTPLVQIKAIEFPPEVRFEDIEYFVGVGTDFDFHITVHSLIPDVYLPIGNYTFEYDADS